MPGREIKGQSKRANYRHGGRTGLENGGKLDIPIDKWKKPQANEQVVGKVVEELYVDMVEHI